MSTNVLVLNFSYQALNITSIKRAVRLLYSGKAEIVHDRYKFMEHPTYELKMPSIIRMLYMINQGKKKVQLTKKNVLLRDRYLCSYCGRLGDRNSMTVDHIIPKSRGGKSSWENLAASCSPCNSRKDNRNPKEANMPLRIKPKEPRYIPFFVLKCHTDDGEWLKYLGLYNVSIEDRIETTT